MGRYSEERNDRMGRTFRVNGRRIKSVDFMALDDVMQVKSRVVS
jgi:IMP dehydrogenase/GMP reductase